MSISVCWSMTVWAQHPQDGTIIHIYGYDYGKPDRTLCGIRTTWNWNFEVHDYGSSEFDGCKRCKSALKRRECQK